MCKAIKIATCDRADVKLLISFMVRDENKVKSIFGKVGGF
jgi:hypothetical protein